MNLSTNIVEGLIVRIRYLRESRDTRLYSLTNWILLDLLPKSDEDTRPLGSRTDDVHVASEHIEKLR